jgi:ATP-binding cassette subfamily F protein uup
MFIPSINTKETPKVIEAKPVPKSEKKSAPAGISREDQKELSRLENKIKQLEADRKKLQDSFLDESIDPETMTENSIKLGAVKEELEQKEMEWLELTERLGV